VPEVARRGALLVLHRLPGGPGQPPHDLDDTFTIVDAGRNNAVLATVDSISAPELVYPEAIYLHEGDTYFVRELDQAQKVAYVERREVDYYAAGPRHAAQAPRSAGDRRWNEAEVGLGTADVSWATVAFKKIRFRSLDAIGYHPLDLPRQNLETVALWFRPEDGVRAQVRIAGLNPHEASRAFGTCSSRSFRSTSCAIAPISAAFSTAPTWGSAIFLYDRYPGGLGYSERVTPRGGPHARGASDGGGVSLRDRVSSCVGLPVLRPAAAAGLRPPAAGPSPTRRRRSSSCPAARALGGGVLSRSLRERISGLIRDGFGRGAERATVTRAPPQPRRTGTPRTATPRTIDAYPSGIEDLLPGGIIEDPHGAAFVHERLYTDLGERPELVFAEVRGVVRARAGARSRASSP
jgi:hypothetical protein